MKSDIRNTTYTRLVEEKSLVLTFTPEEVKALLAIGRTSHHDRVDFLNKTRPSPNHSKERNEACSNILAEIFFAANDFNRNQSKDLAGT